MPDVIIVGGGIVGLSLALNLRATGRAVTVLEAGRCGEGASSFAQGQLVVPNDVSLRELFDESIDYYRGLYQSADRVEAFDRDQVGHVVVSSDSSAMLARTHPHADEVLDRDQLDEIQPGLASDVVAGVRYERAWRIEPRTMTALSAIACRASGIAVHEHHRVVEIDRKAGAWRILTGRGFFEAPTVVLAAGQHTADLSARMGIRLPVHAVAGLVLRTAPTRLTFRSILSEAGQAPDAPWTTPTFTDQEDDAQPHIRFMAHSTNTGQLILGSSWSPPGSTAKASTAQIARAAAKIVPAVADIEIAAAYAGARPCTPDGRPHVGEIAEGLYVNCGHGGAGFIAGPGSSRLLTQTITGTLPFIDPAEFSPARLH